MTVSRPEPLSPHQDAIGAQTSTQAAGRPWIVPTLTIAVLAVILVIAAIAYRMVFADQTYPGVRVLDIPSQSYGIADLRAVVSERATRLAEATLVLKSTGKEYSEKLNRLGIQLDVEATVSKAIAVGRQGNIFEQIGEQVGSLFGGQQVQAAFKIDEAALRGFVALTGKDLNKSPVDSTLVISTTSISTTPSATGTAVNVEATITNVVTALSHGLNGPVEIAVDGLAPGITESDLKTATAMAQTLVSGPIQLSLGERKWTLSATDLAAASVVTRSTAPASTNGAKNGTGKFVATLDPERLKARLASIAGELNRAPRSASFTTDISGTMVVVPAEEGTSLDMDHAVMAISNAAASPTERSVTLQTKVTQPAVGTEDVRIVQGQASALASTPLLLTYKEYTWTIKSVLLAPMVRVKPAEGSTPASAYLDPLMLRNYLGGVAATINRPAQDAVVEERNSIPRLVKTSADGLALDTEASLAAIAAQAPTGNRVVALIVKEQKPAVEVQVPDLLATASTSYAGSIWERAHNVTLATSRLNGTLVPPGAEFSFNQSVGRVSVANGYEIGYGIAWADGQMQTIPSEGGGICQVASTLFHAAFWSGLEITDRSHHMYWISRYGQPPSGLTGLDATVDDGYGIDLRFRNNTGNWILVRSAYDDESIYFSIYGTDPKWKVDVEGPTLSNWVTADRTLVREENSYMKPGQEVYVEHAEDGFDSLIIRIVTKDGKVVDKLELSSHYRPSRNVLLVSPSAKTPTPVPGTPKPGGTPVPATPATGTPVPAPTATPKP